jgi:hypothetical protein
MTVLLEFEPKRLSIEEHLSHVAQLVDDELSDFAVEHGSSMLHGKALAPKAAGQFAQLTRDYRLLMRTVEALTSRST